MLNIDDGNTITPAAVAWSNVTGVVVDRIAWDRWSAYVEDGEPWQIGEPADGATLLDSGHRFTAMVVYEDGKWNSVGWSDSQGEIQDFAVELASDRGLPLRHNPSMTAYLRALN